MLCLHTLKFSLLFVPVLENIKGCNLPHFFKSLLMRIAEITVEYCCYPVTNNKLCPCQSYANISENNLEETESKTCHPSALAKFCSIVNRIS